MSKEMTAVEYFRAKKRMTDGCAKSCNDCLLHGNVNKFLLSCNALELIHPEEAVAIVEKWVEEHLIRTRQSETIKLFPNIELNSKGIIFLLPCRVDVNAKKERCNKFKDCNKCAENYWKQEID